MKPWFFISFFIFYFCLGISHESIVFCNEFFPCHGGEVGKWNAHFYMFFDNFFCITWRKLLWTRKSWKIKYMCEKLRIWTKWKKFCEKYDERRLSPLENARPKWSAPYSEDSSGDWFPYRTADTCSPAYRDGVQTTVSTSIEPRAVPSST